MTDSHFIKVYVRSRPLNIGEQQADLEFDEDEVNLGKRYVFDGVFPPDSTQEKVYQSVVDPLIGHVLKGSKCTVFAYGPTGTGKTYTMEGDEQNFGIIPRAVSHIFDSLRTKWGKFCVQVSFVELYNEDIYDLLSGTEETTKLKIYDDVHRNSVRIEGLKETTIESASSITEILRQGAAKRQTAATLLNALSSRSHSIFSITILTRQSDAGEFKKFGKLSLVDLAGSENIARSGAQDRNAREAGSINQSLLTLTRVISALVEKRPHVPYRESKLTRILQDSLGGSTRTAMIATISPAEADKHGTASTLDYASRAKSIKNHTEVLMNHSRFGGNARACTCRDFEQVKLAHAEEFDMFQRNLTHGKSEIEIRNEVAEEFKKLVDQRHQVFETMKSEMQAQSREEIKRLEAELEKSAEENQRLQGMVPEKSESEIRNELAEEFQKQINERDQLVEQLKSELEEAVAENQRLQCVVPKKSEIEIRNEAAEELKKLVDEKDRHLERMQADLKEMAESSKLTQKLYDDAMQRIHDLEDELASIKRATTPEKSTRAAVKRVPKQAACEDNYANLTFDGDDEIVQVSAKKRPRAFTKREFCQPLTMSGKKQNLATGADVEISPPVRLTRSRASKKKLAF